MSNDLSQKYSKTTRITHGLTALFILALFPLGKYMTGLETTEKMGLIKVHIALGLIVFALTILRSYSYFKHERPTEIKTGSKLNDRLIAWIHNAFYFLLFAIAISGLATMFLGGYGEALQSSNPNLIKPAAEIPPLKAHGITSLLMMLLLVMHVVGFIKHWIAKKENTLTRVI